MQPIPQVLELREKLAQRRLLTALEVARDAGFDCPPLIFSGNPIVARCQMLEYCANSMERVLKLAAEMPQVKARKASKETPTAAAEPKAEAPSKEPTAMATAFANAATRKK